MSAPGARTPAQPSALLRKEVTAELLRGRVFAALLWVLCALTSFMYFFVRFSIDGNRRALRSLPALSAMQGALVTAMDANTILARNFLLALILLTGFVFGMFFHRFFRANRRNVGCLKSLGFRDSQLRAHFVRFAGLMGVSGAAAGLVGGYFGSGVLIAASERSYELHGLVKGLSLPSLLTGLFLPTLVFCAVAFVSYGAVRGREAGSLLAGPKDSARAPAVADRCVRVLPVRDKFPLRIALRRPVPVVLLLVAVMGFSVMFILAYSLTISSGRVYDAQTAGRGYAFDTSFDTPRAGAAAGMRYLAAQGAVGAAGAETVNQRIVGFAEDGPLLELMGRAGNILALPGQGQAYIGPGLMEVYGYRAGDKISLTIGDSILMLTVGEVAANAESDTVYVDRAALAGAMSLPENVWNGVLSLEPVEGGRQTTWQQRLDELDRAAVSNRISAVINQATGCAVGIILIYLALLMNFEDSTRDILILHLMGYRVKAIRRLLIDVYRPILWMFYLAALWPGIAIVRSIRRSLSVQTGDYMPFGTNIPVLLGVFLVLNLIYYAVQATFNHGIRRIVRGEAYGEYAGAEYSEST